MQNFKGLIPRYLLNEQQMNALNRKTQQFRKITVQSSQITTCIMKVYEIYLLQLPKIMDLLLDEDPQGIATFYTLLKNVYTEMYKQYHNFILDFIQTPSNQMTNSNSMRYVNFSGCVLTFQKVLKSYANSENLTVQSAKKYVKYQKLLVSSIQAYKQSFAQAKLIYNIDEKIRRYSVCQQNYKNVTQQHGSLSQLKQKLAQKKKQVIQTFQLLCNEMNVHENQLNIKTFMFLSKFNVNMCENLKKRLNLTRQGRKKAEKLKILNFFEEYNFEQKQEATQKNEQNDKQLKRRRKAQLSSLSNNIPSLNKAEIESHNEILKRNLARLQKYIQFKKYQHLRIYQFHVQFYKTAQRKCMSQLKQSVANLQKNKKKIKQILTNRCYEQLKTTLTIIKITMEVYTEAQKKIGSKMQNIIQNIQQLKSLLNKLVQQVHLIVDKNINSTDQSISYIDYKQKVTNINALIKSTDEKLSIIFIHLKQNYSQVLNIYQLSINDAYDQCAEIGKCTASLQQQRMKQIKQFKSERLKSTSFSELLNDDVKVNISFEDQLDKNNEFKKLKKPVQMQFLKDKDINNSVKDQIQRQECMADADQKIQGSPTKNKKKHQDFIQSRISFVQGQQYLGTFSCALADKIILQGRLYITSHRICFYSKFNTSTVFFGQTFIKVPKKDIIALQKRKNGIFFDNSISITTVKGQLFLTSFFKRNEAFKLISELIGVNYEQQAYQNDNAFQSDSSEINSSPMKIQKQLLQTKKQQIDQVIEDDIKQEQILQRDESIQKLLNQLTFNFKQCASAQFNFYGLTAFKLLQVLVLEGQLTVLGKKYINYTQYYKKVVLLHKDIEITSFEPPIKQHLNSNNIKLTFPLRVIRKLNSTVPTPSSGIPFMPKFAKTHQTQSLYIVSKHRWILDTELQNSGAPYTDSFKVYYRTTCDSTTTSCKIVTKLFINFTKSVMVRGIIESKTNEESKVQLTKQYQQLKKYLSSMQKQRQQKERDKQKKKKSMQSVSNESELTLKSVQTEKQIEKEQDEKVKELEEKLNELSEKYQNNMKSLNGKITKYQILLLSMIVLNMVMVFGWVLG